jgi:glucokinase
MVTASAGVGVAELVDREGAVLSEATIAWKGISLKSRIQAATSLPVHVDADVRAAARAEARLGAGRGLGCFLYVTVGTGISSCLVLEGIPYVGARGLTGTFASSRGLIPAGGSQLIGGPPLEEFAAGPALATRYAQVCPGFVGTAVDVLSLAESADRNAESIAGSAGRALGAAIAQLVNVLDPEAVVIGGGLGLAGGVYRASVEDALRAHVWSEYHRDIPLRSAALGVDAGWIGAALGSAH